MNKKIKNLNIQKIITYKWFKKLQNKIIITFEDIEQNYKGQGDNKPIGKFIKTPWNRKQNGINDAGGGTMALMHGRVFEKVGVHISSIKGNFPLKFAKKIKGAINNPIFWATGISLIAHMQNPNIPAIHMNTRFIITSKSWFGGCIDLTPVLLKRRNQTDPDSIDFHAAMKKLCNDHNVADYKKYKNWCDKYFYLPHRKEARGIGGIFYDYLNSNDFDADFSFTKSVGLKFLDIYPKIIKRNMVIKWTKSQRKEQLIKRGHYVEFNLLYDRGTIFGLKTNGNIDSILSSMPPKVHWP